VAVPSPVEPETARSGQAMRPVSPRLLTPFSLFNLVQFPNLECATDTGLTMEYKTLTERDIRGVIEKNVYYLETESFARLCYCTKYKILPAILSADVLLRVLGNM
jgi:hypothetical protein